MGNNSKLSFSKKRKSRKQIMRNFWKKQRKGSKTEFPSKSSLAECSFQSIESSSDDDEVFVIEKDTSQEQIYIPSGRRIVDIGHLFSELKNIKHDIYSCSFFNVDIVHEAHFGFKSVFKYKCSMCGVTGTFSTEKADNNINEAAVCGTVAIGAGYSQLTEFCAALNIPQLNKKTYIKTEGKILHIAENVALDEMLAAGQKERALAIEAGEIDKDGVPYITVVW